MNRASCSGLQRGSRILHGRHGIRWFVGWARSSRWDEVNDVLLIVLKIEVRLFGKQGKDSLAAAAQGTRDLLWLHDPTAPPLGVQLEL